MIVTDKERIQQVLLILLSNAIKFTSNGKVTILAQLITKNERLDEIDSNLSNKYLEVQVKDRGIGIS